MTTWENVLRLANEGNLEPPRRVEKTADEWRTQLSSERFEVTRRGGTERAFSSKMCSAFEQGIYSCACCGTALFDSTTKFDSGTGWPSFSEPAAENVVSYHSDASYGMVRVETTCSVCDAHLGHVFPDGPQRGTLRYCINALSLEKKLSL
jgi:peptide-methionine (R)-S-oxide reductase